MLATRITSTPIVALDARRRAALSLTTGLLVLTAAVHGAGGDRHEATEGGSFCSQTARALFAACGFEREDVYWTDVAKCINVSEGPARATCYQEVRTSAREKAQLCRAQLSERRHACALLGQSRYDPEFEAGDFERDYANPSATNRYFPLRVGSKWEYRGGTEVNTIEIMNQTKQIDGVTCLVVRDRVFLNGALAEDTEDWYAQHKNGDVWYCGEEVRDYESFDGDTPRRPELVAIDGSFKAGRDGDKPGVIFKAAPVAGETYLEEFSLGNAEDVTEILSSTYAYGQSRELDALVPSGLARLLCAGDCVVTKNYSLLEPGVVARKYFAPGIGFFLEVKPHQGIDVQLTACNVDERCSQLPRP